MIMLTMVLRLNALSCLVFGGLFALQPGLVSTYLAHTQPAPDGVILVTGLGLVANACYLLLVALMVGVFGALQWRLATTLRKG